MEIEWADLLRQTARTHWVNKGESPWSLASEKWWGVRDFLLLNPDVKDPWRDLPQSKNCFVPDYNRLEKCRRQIEIAGGVINPLPVGPAKVFVASRPGETLRGFVLRLGYAPPGQWGDSLDAGYKDMKFLNPSLQQKRPLEPLPPGRYRGWLPQTERWVGP